jgi:hypothetical protein
MLSNPAVPSVRRIITAPESPALAILDAALSVSEQTLLSHHPQLTDLSQAFPRRLPPPTYAIASLLLSRTAELRELLSWYRAALDDSIDGVLHDDEFDLPF